MCDEVSNLEQSESHPATGTGTGESASTRTGESASTRTGASTSTGSSTRSSETTGQSEKRKAAQRVKRSLKREQSVDMVSKIVEIYRCTTFFSCRTPSEMNWLDQSLRQSLRELPSNELLVWLYAMLAYLYGTGRQECISIHFKNVGSCESIVRGLFQAFERADSVSKSCENPAAGHVCLNFDHFKKN